MPCGSANPPSFCIARLSRDNEMKRATLRVIAISLLGVAFYHPIRGGFLDLLIAAERRPPFETTFSEASTPQQAGQQSFVGVITDSECPKGDHSQMQMGPNDAECAKACVNAHGAVWVLYDGKNAYDLSDQQAPEKFAGKRVRVNGALDAKSRKIQVSSITAAG